MLQSWKKIFIFPTSCNAQNTHHFFFPFSRLWFFQLCNFYLFSTLPGFRHDDLELEYLPEITSRGLSLATRWSIRMISIIKIWMEIMTMSIDQHICRPGETVELPCDASDADKFVRVWMKVQDKIYKWSWCKKGEECLDDHNVQLSRSMINQDKINDQEDMMLFTGGIRLTEDQRFNLVGPTNSTLMVSPLNV